MPYLLVFALIILASCGFEPVYKDTAFGGEAGTSTQNFMQSIDIGVIPDREGQSLRNKLIDRLYSNGYPSAPVYRLVTAPVRESIVEIGIDKNDNASRAQLRLSTTIQLIRLSDSAVVLTRHVRATTGYNILQGQFTTFVTENDAREQGLRSLADKIVTQLELYRGR